MQYRVAGAKNQVIFSFIFKSNQILEIDDSTVFYLSNFKLWTLEPWTLIVTFFLDKEMWRAEDGHLKRKEKP